MQGHYARALRQLEGAPTPGQSEAGRANLRGLALMMSGNTAAAITSFDTALDLEPSMQEARLNRGIARLRDGEPARAASDFETIWKEPASPLRARAAYHLALAADAQKKSDDAVKWVGRALEADAAYDDALLYSGSLYERTGDLQAAGRAYKTYLQRHPDSPAALLRFGVSAQRSGFADTARKYLQRVVEVAPSSAEAVEARKFLVMWE